MNLSFSRTSARRVAVSLGVFGLCAFMFTDAAAQEGALPAAELAARYPDGAIRSVSDADAALAEAGRVRLEINARYVAEEAACQPEFFVTACVDRAKERKRQALSLLRPVELEAKTYKRRVRVEDRDAALAAKRESDQARQLENGAVVAVRPRTLAPDASNKSAAAESSRSARDRIADHEAKLKRQQADEQAGAQARAERIASYEQKVRDSEKRQQEVARRKAKKEEKRRAKQEVAANPIR